MKNSPLVTRRIELFRSRAFALWIVLGISFSGNAQFSDDKYFNKAEMTEDIQDLVEKILDSHTDPFAFLSKSEFDSLVESTLDALPDSATIAMFIPYVADVINALKDSHSTVDYSALIGYIFANKGFIIPIRIISNEDGIYLVRDRDRTLPEGARLLTINGHSADSLWNIGYRFACIEGRAETGRRRVADAIYPIILAMYGQLEKKILVDVLPQGSEDIYRYTYRPLDEKRWKALQKELEKTEFSEPVKIDFPEDGVAHLTVETFGPDNSVRYGRLLRKAFSQIRDSDAEFLIIDLRDNGGGSSSWVEYLYSFIDDRGYNTPHNIIGRNSELSQSRYRYLNKRFNRFLVRRFRGRDENVRGMFSIYDAPYGINDTIYFTEPMVQRKSDVFTGTCYLLINGLTASASVDFSNHFKREKRGLIFGEACFGPITGTWGNPARYHLTNSKLPTFIATIRYNYDASFRYEEEAIEPDVAVPFNPEALTRGDDYPLQFLLDFLNKRP